MNKRTGCFLFVAVMALVGGCSKPPQVTAASPGASSHVGSVSDSNVTEHVKTALHQDELLKGFNIGVVTLKGDVRLIGAVESQAQIDEAGNIARVADGAHTVHNELTIKP